MDGAQNKKRFYAKRGRLLRRKSLMDQKSKSEYQFLFHVLSCVNSFNMK